MYQAVAEETAAPVQVATCGVISAVLQSDLSLQRDTASQLQVTKALRLVAAQQTGHELTQHTCRSHTLTAMRLGQGAPGTRRNGSKRL